MSKQRKILVGILGVFLIATLSLLWYRQHSTEHSKHRSGLAQKEEKYVCPMHPQISSDKPGSCPICGMDLVMPQGLSGVEENHDDHDHSNHTEVPTHSGFKLSLKKQQKIGVKTTQVVKKNLFKSIRAPGRIAFDPELYTAQSEYLEALRQWKRIKNSPLQEVRQSTQEMIRSTKIRLKVLGLSDSQIKNLARKGEQSEGLLVTGKGQDNWVYADIFEMDLPFIKKGLSAQITANFLQGKTLAGKVISVDQVITPDTRTAKVRIQLKESDPSIRPESYVNVTIFAPLGERIAIPLEAIMDTGRETYVFVKEQEGKFEPRRVRIAHETDDEAGILSGLSAGEEIVVGGNFMLDSESRLKAVIQGSPSASEHQH